MATGRSDSPERTTPIPLFVRDGALASIRSRIGERVGTVLDSRRYILGEEVEGFEAEFASYLGREHCVGVGNGTDALMIGLLALGVRPGDEVVVPAVSFFATAEAVAAIGAQPVFADVEPGTWTISARSAEPVLGEKTAAIVPVHLFGNPAPMRELLELAAANDVPVFGDAAQAAGARLDGQMAGALGHAAAFSFYPGKNLGAIGDAGAVVTDDAEVAALARRLRDHGSADKRIHTEVGFNSRLDAIQAAALRVALPCLDEWTVARRSAAAAYREAGLGELVELPVETPGAASCYHLFVVASPQRDRLHEALGARGIETRVYYTPVLPEQPALRDFRPDAPLLGAQRYRERSLALPMGESLDADAVERVVEAISETLSSFHKLDR
jgi:dTDP-3-amino-3,4,6-trideoxy-alpha-D-glucose transaminase